MFITKTSMITGQQNTIWIEGLTASMLKEWEGGALAQDALRGIPQELREFIMTGITPDEWDKAFSGVEEEDIEWDDAGPRASPKDVIETARKFVELIEADDTVRLFPK